jgi:cytochrome c peroxidase
VEMGFSGTNGDPDIDSLFRKIASKDYYSTLFTHVYGNSIVTETRIQNALAQFIRSIQSFDSKFDAGLVTANNINTGFNNFTNDENTGENLFLTPPQFDNTGSRIGGGTDLTNTKSPSLKDLFNSSGTLMHNGSFANLSAVISHYNSIPNQTGNNNLDPRLRLGENFQQLNLTPQEINQIVAFVKTLSGNSIYTEDKWSNPFDLNENINIVDLTTSISKVDQDLITNIFQYPVLINSRFRVTLKIVIYVFSISLAH